MTVKFDEPTKTIGITPYTKNETYQYTGSTFGVNFTINSEDDWDLTKFSPYYRSFATRAKNDKDLTVTTLFYDSVKNSTKLVTTTISNFFEGKYNYVQIPNCDLNLIAPTQVKPNDDATYYVRSLDGMDFTAGSDFILGSDAKYDVLNLVKGGGDTVYDLKGNDSYNLDSQSYQSGSYQYVDAIYDFDGNDDYAAIANNKTQIADFKGNDSYTTQFDNAYTEVFDYAGKDEYFSTDNATLKVIDYNGNDYYYSNRGNLNVHDYLGNDNYVKDVYNYADYSYTNIKKEMIIILFFMMSLVCSMVH